MLSQVEVYDDPALERYLTRVHAFDLRRQAATAFAEEMAASLEVEVRVVDRPRDAVAGMDLVVTSGPILQDPAPVIEPGWLAEGAFACPVDFDSYWQGEALRQASKLATDDRPQLAYYRRAGYFRHTPQPYADLGEIVAGSKPGRESDAERIICINLGLALDDMATAILIYRRAVAAGIGTELPL